MIGDRSGYATGGTFVLVAVNKYVVNKCCCSQIEKVIGMKLCESIISRN